jgi:hypothetical protein
MMTLDLRAITLTERRDGFVWLQPQPYGEKGTGTSYEAIPPFGLTGRPRSPTNGQAANGLVLRSGPEGWVIATTDPRYQELLPDMGEGGAALYATATVSGSVVTPYLGFFGADGAEDEGLFRLNAPTAAGTSKVEIDPTTGDVTVTHAAGTVVVVKAASVELGAASGGTPLALATPIIAWAATVEARLATLGQSGTAPAGVATTKVNGT